MHYKCNVAVRGSGMVTMFCHSSGTALGTWKAFLKSPKLINQPSEIEYALWSIQQQTRITMQNHTREKL